MRLARKNRYSLVSTGTGRGYTNKNKPKIMMKKHWSRKNRWKARKNKLVRSELSNKKLVIPVLQ